MTLPRLTAATSGVPTSQLELPERAVQFGTGAFLRGFVDFFLDVANAQGQFNGRVVAISTTGSGRDRAFAEQAGAFTLVARGIAHGERREEIRVITSVSRALSATDEWAEVLACARNPLLALVFSNTTEVGIHLADGDVLSANPPPSFPAKLTRFLHERARTFAYDTLKGVLVVPCELIEDNGNVLRSLVLELALRWQLEPEFVRWLASSVTFCNTLVDRIVPGAPSATEADALAERVGYRDSLMTTAEHFRQFVIEGDDTVRARLGFAEADAGIIVTRDVAAYRERKVRLLNGAHTAAVNLALLAGCVTVRDAMIHPVIGAFVRRVVMDELLPVVTAPDAHAFARSVIERFENPHIQHALVDITMQGTTKLKVRLVPAIEAYAARFGRAPDALALGFAAHVYFLHPAVQADRAAKGMQTRRDDAGERIMFAWSAFDADRGDVRSLVSDLAADRTLWDADLAVVPGFVELVTRHLQTLLMPGAVDAQVARCVESLPTEVAV